MPQHLITLAEHSKLFWSSFSNSTTKSRLPQFLNKKQPNKWHPSHYHCAETAPKKSRHDKIKNNNNPTHRISFPSQHHAPCWNTCRKPSPVEPARLFLFGGDDLGVTGQTRKNVCWSTFAHTRQEEVREAMQPELSCAPCAIPPTGVLALRNEWRSSLGKKNKQMIMQRHWCDKKEKGKQISAAFCSTYKRC